MTSFAIGLAFMSIILIIFAVVLNGNTPKEKNIKQLKVPEEHILELLAMATAAQTLDNGAKNYSAHFKLWAKIEEIFPETRIGHWRWMQHGTDLYIIQTSKKSKL